jgi:hypothetical protein
MVDGGSNRHHVSVVLSTGKKKTPNRWWVGLRDVLDILGNRNICYNPAWIRIADRPALRLVAVTMTPSSQWTNVVSKFCGKRINIRNNVQRPNINITDIYCFWQEDFFLVRPKKGGSTKRSSEGNLCVMLCPISQLSTLIFGHERSQEICHE